MKHLLTALVIISSTLTSNAQRIHDTFFGCRLGETEKGEAWLTLHNQGYRTYEDEDEYDEHIIVKNISYGGVTFEKAVFEFDDYNYALKTIEMTRFYSRRASAEKALNTVVNYIRQCRNVSITTNVGTYLFLATDISGSISVTGGVGSGYLLLMLWNSDTDYNDW